VVNSTSDTVTPIATSTFTAGTPFSPGVSGPLFDAVTPDGASLLVGGSSSSNIAVISTSDTSDIQTVTVGSGPNGIAILPNGRAAYVANLNDGTVSVISLTGTPAVTATIPFSSPGCASPEGIAATPDSKDVYVVCQGGQVWQITVAHNTVASQPINVPQTSGNEQIVITPDGKTAYVSNTNGYVYPVTLADNTVGTGIPVPGAWGLAISPDGAYVLAGDGDCCSVNTPVSVIKVSTNTVTTTLQTGSNYVHRWLAFQPNGAAATPVVSEVSPATGFTTGGGTATITGSGFTGANTVDFGTIPATINAVTGDSSITVTVPPEAPGTVDVTVTAPGGISSVTPADEYTYTVDQTTPNTEPCSPTCTTNTVSTPLDQTSISVTGSSGTTSPAATNLLVNTATLSCGASKTHDYDYLTAVSDLFTTGSFATGQALTITETVGDEPSTVGVKVCYAAGSDSTGSLLRPCKRSKKAPCLESLTEQSGDMAVATFLSPANDPRFWTGGAAADLKAFAPPKGAPGAAVTITGKNLAQVQSVEIGGAEATISPESTNTKLKVTVPLTAVAGSGLITVTAASGETVSTKEFTVT
jgi:YVTN family beta-propeller protein